MRLPHSSRNARREWLRTRTEWAYRHRVRDTCGLHAWRKVAAQNCEYARKQRTPRFVANDPAHEEQAARLNRFMGSGEWMEVTYSERKP